MALSTRPFLVLYVVWHPAFDQGRLIAKKLYEHYRRELYSNVAGGVGLSVIYRYVSDPITSAPAIIDFSESSVNAVVMLIDENFARDSNYAAWANKLFLQTDAIGLSARVFPVSISAEAVHMGFSEQAMRWDRWSTLGTEARLRHLTTDLTYQLSRMLRSYLEHLHRPSEEDAALEQYLKKVQIFLSHSKHDADGERIAHQIRQHIVNKGLASFFDVHDIPTGVRFDKVLLLQVKVSAVVALHTDSFSSREWCRREILEAKRWNVPLVVADCISDTDERIFPYMGNVPVVRMDPDKVDRIEHIVARLLDEVLKDFLWRCRIQLIQRSAKSIEAAFLPRSPELISLAELSSCPGDRVIVIYPDPPLGAEEKRLFEQIAPRYQLCSLNEWLATAGVVE